MPVRRRSGGNLTTFVRFAFSSGKSYSGRVPDDEQPSHHANPERWVEEHGDYLFRYALSRLRDPVRAEDAVQETFLAALKAGNFAGRSAEKSWLTGILKNKIFDHFRKAGRE